MEWPVRCCLAHGAKNHGIDSLVKLQQSLWATGSHTRRHALAGQLCQGSRLGQLVLLAQAQRPRPRYRCEQSCTNVTHVSL